MFGRLIGLLVDRSICNDFPKGKAVTLVLFVVAHSSANHCRPARHPGVSASRGRLLLPEGSGCQGRRVCRAGVLWFGGPGRTAGRCRIGGQSFLFYVGRILGGPELG